MITSCSDFLDTAPLDALSPATTWKTEDDAQKFAIGCYGGNNYDTSSWEDGGNILYLDCGSDFGYNNFEWENYKTIGNGTMTPSGAVASFYDFSVIRRCNTFLEKVKEIPFSNEQTKNDLIGQVRTIRAYRYFVMNWWYGGVPVIDNYNSADEAKVPRKSEEEVKNYVNTELDTAIGELNASPSERGRIAKGAAMAIRMRSALYYGDYVKAKEMAEAIMMQRTAFLQRNANHCLLGSGRRLADRFRHFARLAMTKADATLLVADDDESSEAEATTTLHHLGDAVDMDQAIDELAVALFVAIPIPVIAFTFSHCLYLSRSGPALEVESALAGVPGVIGNDEEQGDELRAIEFERIKGGKPFDITEHLKIGKAKAEQFVSVLVNKVGSALDISNIILAGGGAEFFKDVLADKFPKHEIITTSDPVFANVRGFQRAGQQFADQIFKRG